MKHAKRLQALENVVQAVRGWRYYSTNDDLEGAGWFVDCTGDELNYRSSLAASGEHIKSPDDLDDEQRARVVGRERIEQDERAGYRVMIVKYTSHWRGA
jgi:hypothetical protein